jgi:hypothetical protein
MFQSERPKRLGEPSYARNRATTSAAGSALAIATLVPAHRLNPFASPADLAAARNGEVR